MLLNRWPLLLQALLMAVILVQLGRGAWMLAEPLRASRVDAAITSDATPPAEVPALAGRDPFFGGRGTPLEPAADANGWRVYGLRTGADGGSAILAHESGPQRTFGIGEELAPGVVLAAVAGDHAVLRVGGSERRLEIPETPGTPTLPTGAAAPAPPAAAPAPDAAQAVAIADVDPGQLLAQAGLRPALEGGRIAGYTLLPRGDSRLIQAAGLQAGDVLTGVNGESLGPERLPEVLAQLQSNPRAVITYRRDGQTRTVTLGSGPE